MKKSSGKSRKRLNAGIQIAVEHSTSPHSGAPAHHLPSVPATDLIQENAELRAQLAESQETLRAIREGEVDAIVVSGSQGERIFSLTGAESVYRLIVETMKEAAFTAALDGTILFANAQFGEYVKRPMEEILGHTLHEFVPLDQCMAVESLLDLSLKAPVKSRLVFRRADGSLVPAFVSSNLLNQPDGLSICVVATDLSELENSTHLIQELRRQEEALRASEERFRSVLDNSTDTIYRFNLKTGRYEYFSPAVIDVYGYSSEEMMEMNERDTFARIHPDDRASVEAFLSELLISGKGEIDFRWKNKAGEYRWLSARSTIIRDATGRPLYREGITRNINFRKQAEEALNLAATKYSSMFNTTSDGVWVQDLEGRILEVNDAYCRMSGFGRRELVGMSIGKLEVKESADEIDARLRRLLDGSGHDRFESRHRRKDGSVLDVDITAVRLDIEGGRIAAFIRDITEQKQLVSMLQRKTKEQETILDSTQAMIFFKDKQNHLLLVNRAFEEVAGLAKEQVEGSSLFDLYSREQAEKYWRDDLEVIGSGRAKRGISEKMETPQGTKILQTDKIPYYNEQGYIEGVIGFSVDVTDLKQTEEALRRTADRLQLLSNCAGRLLSSDDPQSIVNELCREVMTHLDCQAFFNFMVDERAGKLRLNACAGIPDEEACRIEWLDYGAAVCGCVAQEGSRIIAEDILHVPDPRADLVRTYGIQAYCCHPLKTQGRVIGTLSFGTKNRAHFTAEEVEVMRTVADQVAVAMQRVINLRALRELNESLEQRVAERTAEVRQQAKRLHALAAELSQAEQRERKRLAGVLHDHIQQLLVAAKMHLDLVKHANEITIGPAIQGVESIIREAIDASRSLAMDLSPPILHQGGLAPALGWLANRMEEKNLFKVRVQADSDAEPGTESMRLMLFESVRELLLNAVKHSGVREARVMMNRGPDGWTKITVEDDGSGFDPQALTEFRNGLGLFGIQQRLTYMGGMLEVESAPGHGTRAILLSPSEKTLKEAQEPVAAAADEQVQEFVGFGRKRKKICVLLVDDHRIVRQGLANLLQLETDLEIVAEAEDGQQALQLAHKWKPDVVVTDVSMPGMDGVELTRRLLRELPGVKVLGLSMHIEKDVAAAMREAGAVGYLTKGGLSEDLVAAIRACAVRT